MNKKSKKKGRKPKVIPLCFQRSHVSLSQLLTTGSHKRQIKELSRNNKDLALALQEAKCKAAAQEARLEEFSKENSQMMFARLKLKEMAVTVQKLVSNMDEVLGYLDVKPFSLMHNSGFSHEENRLRIMQPNIETIDESPSSSYVESAETTWRNSSDQESNTILPSEKSTEQGVNSSAASEAPSNCAASSANGDLDKKNTHFQFEMDNSETEIYHVPTASNVEKETQGKGKCIEADLNKTPPTPQLHLSCDYEQLSTKKPPSLQSWDNVSQMMGQTNQPLPFSKIMNKKVSKIPKKLPPPPSPIVSIEQVDISERNRRDTFVVNRAMSNETPMSTFDRRGTFVVSSFPEVSDVYNNRRATYFVKETPVKTSPSVQTSEKTVLLYEDMEMTEMVPVQVGADVTETVPVQVGAEMTEVVPVQVVAEMTEKVPVQLGTKNLPPVEDKVPVQTPTNSPLQDKSFLDETPKLNLVRVDDDDSICTPDFASFAAWSSRKTVIHKKGINEEVEGKPEDVIGSGAASSRKTFVLWKDKPECGPSKKSGKFTVTKEKRMRRSSRKSLLVKDVSSRERTLRKSSRLSVMVKDPPSTETSRKSSSCYSSFEIGEGQDLENESPPIAVEKLEEMPVRGEGDRASDKCSLRTSKTKSSFDKGKRPFSGVCERRSKKGSSRRCSEFFDEISTLSLNQRSASTESVFNGPLTVDEKTETSAVPGHELRRSKRRTVSNPELSYINEENTEVYAASNVNGRAANSRNPPNSGVSVDDERTEIYAVLGFKSPPNSGVVSTSERSEMYSAPGVSKNTSSEVVSVYDESTEIYAVPGVPKTSPGSGVVSVDDERTEVYTVSHDIVSARQPELVKTLNKGSKNKETDIEKLTHHNTSPESCKTVLSKKTSPTVDKKAKHLVMKNDKSDLLKAPIGSNSDICPAMHDKNDNNFLKKDKALQKEKNCNSEKITSVSKKTKVVDNATDTTAVEKKRSKTILNPSVGLVKVKDTEAFAIGDKNHTDIDPNTASKQKVMPAFEKTKVCPVSGKLVKTTIWPEIISHEKMSDEKKEMENVKKLTNPTKGAHISKKPNPKIRPPPLDDKDMQVPALIQKVMVSQEKTIHNTGFSPIDDEKTEIYAIHDKYFTGKPIVSNNPENILNDVKKMDDPSVSDGNCPTFKLKDFVKLPKKRCNERKEPTKKMKKTKNPETRGESSPKKHDPLLNEKENHPLLVCDVISMDIRSKTPPKVHPLVNDNINQPLSENNSPFELDPLTMPLTMTSKDIPSETADKNKGNVKNHRKVSPRKRCDSVTKQEKLSTLAMEGNAFDPVSNPCSRQPSAAFSNTESRGSSISEASADGYRSRSSRSKSVRSYKEPSLNKKMRR